MNTSNEPTPDDEAALGRAFELRRRRELSARSQPDDSATGTTRIAERIAAAKANARRQPRRGDIVDLT
ncbi:MAG: hypothetical protein AAF548_10020 [Actinomycetota bacterium]